MDYILDIAVSYAIEVVTIIIVSAIGYFGTKLLAKLNNQTGLENITIATNQVIAAAQETVLELQQLFVETWKESQNGKLTEEQIKVLQDKVLEITYKKLASSTINLLTSAKIDVTTMIVSATESYILELKKEIK